MPIRIARPDELDVVCRLRLAFVAEVQERDAATTVADEWDVTMAFLVDAQRRGILRTWLAEDEAATDVDPVGIVTVITTDAPPLPDLHGTRIGYVVNLWVHPDARGAGIARALMDAVVASAPDLGHRSLQLYATAAGAPLYESMGFATSSRWMTLDLGAPDPCT